MVCSARAEEREVDGVAMRTKQKRACVVAHSLLHMDPRVQREVGALTSAGWAVDLLCLRGPGQPRRDVFDGAQVYRLPVTRHRGSGFGVYLIEYTLFFIFATAVLSWLALRRRYSLIQAHNVPDFLVFAGIVPRLRGARVLLDIRDPLPDLYASKFGGMKRQPLLRLARWIEAVSVRWACHVLTPGEPSRQRLIGRGIPGHKLTNVLNSADPRLFPRRTPEREGEPGEKGFTLVFHGGLFERSGVDIAIRAVGQLRDQICGLRLLIAGSGEEEPELRRLVNELGLQRQVEFAGWVPIERLAEYLAQADLGLAPYRHDTFTDLIYPTKAFECMAMGYPVIISRLAGVVDLLPGVPDLFFEPDDVDALAARILALAHDPARLRRLNEQGQRLYAPLSWQGQQQRYLNLVNELVEAPRLRAGCNAST